MKKNKEKSPYATLGTENIKAPISRRSSDPKAERSESKQDMRVRRSGK